MFISFPLAEKLELQAATPNPHCPAEDHHSPSDLPLLPFVGPLPHALWRLVAPGSGEVLLAVVAGCRFYLWLRSWWVLAPLPQHRRRHRPPGPPEFLEASSSFSWMASSHS